MQNNAAAKLDTHLIKQNLDSQNAWFEKKQTWELAEYASLHDWK